MGDTRRPLLAAVAAAAILAATLPAIAPAAQPATFLVGFGIRDITPSGNVNLGGFGFGCCRVSTAVDHPVRVRAMVVGDEAGRNVALASVEVQGSFAAYDAGAFGQYDIAKAVEAATGGALPREHITLSSDHSHRGADTTGVWGGLPPAEMQRIAEQTKGALLDAYAARAPSVLRVGKFDGGAFVTSDFSSPGQDTPDVWFRLLFVEDAQTRALTGVYGTFSAHATLHGSAARVSPDRPGW